jgi:hypothetical protein
MSENSIKYLTSKEAKKELKVQDCELAHLRINKHLLFIKKRNAYFYLKDSIDHFKKIKTTMKYSIIIIFTLFLYNKPILAQSNVNDIIITSVTKKSDSRINWTKCADYCKSLSSDDHKYWRMPSFEELIFIRNSSSINVPDGWDAWTWSSSPSTPILSAPSTVGNGFMRFDELNGKWSSDESTAKNFCRCVK